MIQQLTSEQKQKIVDILKEKGVTLACPMCGNKNFILIDGYFNNPLQSNFGDFHIGGPSIPSAALACSNCGFISQHALGMLGLLNNPENK
jgi:hypothetical protein